MRILWSGVEEGFKAWVFKPALPPSSGVTELGQPRIRRWAQRTASQGPWRSLSLQVFMLFDHRNTLCL